MFYDIFKRQINSITLAAGLVAISSLSSRLLGVVRDRILAGQFGAGIELDMYYAAFRIPDLVFNLVVLGALSAGFIPVFTGLLGGDQKNEQVAWDLSNNVINFLFLFISTLSLFGILFAPTLMRVVAPGFLPDEQQTVVALTRIMFLSPLFLGISGILGGILQSFKRFLVYSLSPIFYNIGIIVGAVYFSKIWGIYGLAGGVILGAALHMVIQWPAVRHLGYRYQWRLNWRDRSVRQIARLMLPRTLSLATGQINLLATTAIASGLASGSLTIFNFANNLQSFPVGIFGISFAIAAFPSFSALAQDNEGLQASFSRTVRQIFFFVIPATVFIIALRAQIIRVVLGTGNFNWEDTILTMNTLGFFSLSLFAQAAIPLLTRVFYAKQDSATPFYFGLITMVINVVLALLLAPGWGVGGLALAFSVANILYFMLLWLSLTARIGSLQIGKILTSVIKFTASSIMAGVVIQLVKLAIWPFIDMSKFSGVFIQLASSSVLGLAVYIAMCRLLRSEELDSFWAAFRSRWPFKRIKLGDQAEARGL